MPFTANLAEDRGGCPTACCRGPMALGTWESMSWEERRHYCGRCPLRFSGEYSCSLDFLTIGDLNRFKEEASEIVGWVLCSGPTWVTLESSLPELDFAFRAHPPAPKTPKEVVEDFIASRVPPAQDPKFWRDWNRAVEYFGGNLVSKAIDPLGEHLAALLTTTATYAQRPLSLLYSASCVLGASADYLSHRFASNVFRALSEAGRKAIDANATLEVC